MKACRPTRIVCCTMGATATTAFVAVSLLLTPSTSLAVNKYRSSATGYWTDSNWTDGSVPVTEPTTADNALIGSTLQGVNPATVTITNPSAVASILYLGHQSGGDGTVIVTNGAALNASTIRLGYGGANYALLIDSSSVVTAGTVIGFTDTTYDLDPDRIAVTANIYAGQTPGGTGTNAFRLTNGTFNVGSGLVLGYTVGRVGLFELGEGATLNVLGNLSVGYNGIGVFDAASNSTLNVTDSVRIGDGSSFEYIGGKFSFSAANLLMAYTDANTSEPARFVQNGGTLTFPSGITLGEQNVGTDPPSSAVVTLTNDAHMTIGSLTLRHYSNNSCRVEGYGILNVGTQFRVDGRAVADGFGQARDLVITNMPAVTRGTGAYESPLLQPDGTLAGWYAVNGGRLRLAPVAVANDSGIKTNNWGERVAIATPELVNSVQMEFSNVTGGDLAASLLAVDRADAQIGGPAQNTVIGVWGFDTSGGFSFGAGSAVLTFRYDSALADANGLTEGDLKVWRFNGSKWENVTAGAPDTGAKTISTTSLTSFSLFAVSTENPLSAKGTVVVLR